MGLQLHPGHAVWAEQLFSEAKGITRHIRWPGMLNKAPQDARLKPLTFIAQSGKESSCNAGDQGSIPGLGGSPGEGNGNPLQYSCLENPRDGGAWWADIYGVTQVQTRLMRLSSSHRLVVRGPNPDLKLGLSAPLADFWGRNEELEVESIATGQ